MDRRCNARMNTKRGHSCAWRKFFVGFDRPATYRYAATRCYRYWRRSKHSVIIDLYERHVETCISRPAIKFLVTTWMWLESPQVYRANVDGGVRRETSNRVQILSAIIFVSVLKYALNSHRLRRFLARSSCLIQKQKQKCLLRLSCRGPTDVICRYCFLIWDQDDILESSTWLQVFPQLYI